LPVAHLVGEAGIRAVGQLHRQRGVRGRMPIAVAVRCGVERRGGNARNVRCFQWLLSMRTSFRSGVCPRLT
jgi:hypothetical protein